MIIHATASLDKKGGIDMSDHNRAHFRQWLKDNPGKPFKFETLDKVSTNLRGYYFGAVLPLVRSTCAAWENLEAPELHDVLKKMFFYFETYNPKTQRTERFGRSVMSDSEWNNTKKAMQFLEIIQDYLGNCGIEMPDSAEFKRWKDSAPDKGETFKK